MSDLHTEANRLVLNCVKHNTRRTYDYAQKQYLLYCDKYDFNVMPASEKQIVAFVAYFNKWGLCFSTITVYLAAVRNLHVSSGFADPLRDRPRIKLALRAISLQGQGPKQKFPITHDILVAIKSYSQGTYGAFLCWTAEFRLLWPNASFRILYHEVKI